jgi:acetolactate synthase I/II/III large subunit
VSGDLLRRELAPGGRHSQDAAPPADETTPARRAAAEIVSALCQAGTRLVFGVPGGGPNLDAVGAATEAGLRFVLAHGETAAAIMAATCADVTGAPGAVVVTRGPGLASAVNGIAHATLDRLPLVVIADTVPARDRARISHQRLDQDALGRAVAKGTVTLGARDANRDQAGPDPGTDQAGTDQAGADQAGRDANHNQAGRHAVPHRAGRDAVQEVAEHAVRTALARPAGAVVVNVDPDAPSSAEPTSAEATAAKDSGHPGTPAGGDGTSAKGGEQDTATAGQGLARLESALRDARRPVVLAGLGALAHAGAVRAALAGSGIPVLPTYRAKGIVPDSGDEAAGQFTGGTMEAPLLAAADLIVGLGVDPVELIPARWDYAADAILVTEYPAGSEAYFTGGSEQIAPLAAAIEILARHRDGHDWPAAAGRTAKQDVIERLGWVAVAAPGRLNPQDVVTTVRAHVPPGTIATVDSGAHMLAVMPLWPADEPRRLLISSGLATMGYALPAAIGAALCTPGVPVVAFTGDGGLGMTLMEIETAVRLRLPVIVVVFNDAALSLIKIKQRAAGQGGDAAVLYGRTSFAAAAQAMGATASEARDTGGLAAALTAALGREGPTLIDARVDPAGYPAILDLTRGETGRRSSRDWPRRRVTD